MFYRDRRTFWQCAQCSLVFVDPVERLNATQEKAEYDLHNNDCDDPGYRQFLSRVVTPLCQQIKAPANGLDFGCGPGPALAQMLRERDYNMAIYDPFYAPDKTVLQRQYNFITATEVIEHLFCPHEVLSQLWQLIEPGGILAVMTKLLIDRDAFSSWHYKNDSTHVCFYSLATMQWLSDSLNARWQKMDTDVVFFYKPAEPDYVA